jgi:hypothetical protein
MIDDPTLRHIVNLEISVRLLAEAVDNLVNCPDSSKDDSNKRLADIKNYIGANRG